MFKAIKPKDSQDYDLVFTNGWTISTSHCQDCCEHNYADWSSLDDTGFYDEEFLEDNFWVDKWEGGFRINRYAVNCYSDQSGYYSTDLDISLIDKDGKRLWYKSIDCERGETY
jgi:hypothetical protein